MAKGRSPSLALTHKTWAMKNTKAIGKTISCMATAPTSTPVVLLTQASG